MDNREDFLNSLEESKDLYYTITGLDFSDHVSLFLMKHLSGEVDTRTKGFYEMNYDDLKPGGVIFNYVTSLPGLPVVTVSAVGGQIRLFCGCMQGASKLCEHEVRALYNIHQRPALRLFFDEKFRDAEMRRKAAEYGLEREPVMEDYFELLHENKKTTIVPKIKQLYASSSKLNEELGRKLMPPRPLGDAGVGQADVLVSSEKLALLVSEHRYFGDLTLNLIQGPSTVDGRLKNPIRTIDASTLIWNAEDPAAIKFYNGIARFQSNYERERSDIDLKALMAVVSNPMNLDVYLHDVKSNSNLSASSISPLKLELLKIDIHLNVDVRDDFYEISGKLMVEDMELSLEKVKLKHEYFLVLKDRFCMIGNEGFLKLIAFFKGHGDRLLIHHSKYEDFQNDILSKLEQNVRIDYSYLKPASKKQLIEKGFDLENEQVIYLSESEDFVLITPVIRYGDVEVPVLSRKQIRSKDRNGRQFVVDRDESLELQFITNIVRQHPFFEEQVDRTDNFYLHRSRLMGDNWFLTAFEQWRSKGIVILGFNKLKNNKFNSFKASINVAVRSGMDWFKTSINITYGKEMAALRHLQQSIRNRQKFVRLDDGTLGILPDEWLEKFRAYFDAGEVVDEEIRTPKINFSTIDELYELQQLDEAAQDELLLYRAKFAGAENIVEVQVPEGLTTELRKYQQEGLNWLNFLDDFNFGACLADDMGLGKTVQIIAFILSQRAKVERNTNLIVVPASLVFNWQVEIEKFAPSIRVKTIYGADRVLITDEFDGYEVILTSYGTLLTDIRKIKEYHFNYVFLDESQLIKNPESQRYKAVRMLKSRNKVVITGTPLENNTFDLYGQLSFACPGLLGSKQHFREIYSTPIDQFKDSRAARRLQQRVSPFILRRTKQQVATELPDKTEMVIYCEMEADQRQVYDAYEKEIRDYLTNQTDVEIAGDMMNVLKGITKLRQICNTPALLSDDVYYGASSAKIDVLLEQIIAKSPQHKILVFSQFVGMLDLIRAKLDDEGISYAYLTGQTRNRQAVVDHFQQEDGPRVFLISLKAGGVGLNLTGADYVFLVDPWWNPAVEEQAIDRTYRIGQDKNVVAVRLICTGTVEEKIMKMQEHKRDLVASLIKTDVSVFKRLNKKELLSLLNQ